jgi:hypothetical protein
MRSFYNTMTSQTIYVDTNTLPDELDLPSWKEIKILNQYNRQDDIDTGTEKDGGPWFSADLCFHNPKCKRHRGYGFFCRLNKANKDLLTSKFKYPY